MITPQIPGVHSVNRNCHYSNREGGEMRVNKGDLEAVVNRINKMTKSPTAAYTRMKDGKFKANIGNFHLDWAYGGVSLVRMVTEGGGITTIIHGYGTKRELYHKLHAFIRGMKMMERE